MEAVPKKSDAPFLDWASKILKCRPQVHIARSQEGNSVYRLNHDGDVWYIKISGQLTGERERLHWLQGKLPVADLLGFTEGDCRQALLMAAIPGTDLAHLSCSWPIEKVTRELAAALRRFHSIEIHNCPFGKKTDTGVLLHGDACLPNFIFSNDTLSGYIDLGDVTIGDPEIDLSAAIWSLHYNLGFGHGLRFLKEYGVENANEEMTERLRLQY